MTLGSEFTFHRAINKPVRRESTVRLFQLNHSGEWITQNTVTVEVADRIEKVMEGRGRKGTWRLIDPEKVAPVKRAAKPRVRKAAGKAAQTPAQTTESAEG